MTMIKCEECGKEISDRAVNCPHCGAPTAIVKKAIRFQLTLLFVVCALLLLVVLIASECWSI